jgi:hypothetical protein
MTTFDPTAHISRIKGGDYLEVKWRLVWLRTEHPDATISTELLQLDRDAGFALMRAVVVVPGKGSATGHGSETAKDFPDFIEKAETKALGRALAALGFGTQFCPEFEIPGKVCDSPVAHDDLSPTQGSTTCWACRQKITDTVSDGKRWPAATIAEGTRSKRGHPLCWEHRTLTDDELIALRKARATAPSSKAVR